MALFSFDKNIPREPVLSEQGVVEFFQLFIAYLRDEGFEVQEPEEPMPSEDSGAVAEQLTPAEDEGGATVQAVLDAIEEGLVPIGELEETLVAVQHTLSEIQQQGVALPDSTLTSEEVEHLSEVADAPKLDAKHKLKVTVPIIPVILSYEGEVELKSGLNLEAAWKGLVAKVRGT